MVSKIKTELPLDQTVPLPKGSTSSDSTGVLQEFVSLLDEISTRVKGANDSPQDLFIAPAELVFSQKPEVIQSKPEAKSVEVEPEAAQVKSEGSSELKIDETKPVVDNSAEASVEEKPIVEGEVEVVAENSEELTELPNVGFNNLEAEIAAGPVAEAPQAAAGTLAPLQSELTVDQAEVVPNGTPQQGQLAPEEMVDQLQLAPKEELVQMPVDAQVKKGSKTDLVDILKNEIPVDQESNANIEPLNRPKSLDIAALVVAPEKMEALLENQIKEDLNKTKDSLTAILIRQAMDSVQFQKHGSVVKPAENSAINPIGSLASRARSRQSNVSETEKSSPAPRSIPTRALEKIAQAIKEANKTQISIRLDPPQLGTVHANISLKEGNLHARLVAESPQVNLLLRERAAELHAILKKVGVNVDSVSVSVGSDERSFLGETKSNNSSDHDKHKGSSESRSGDNKDENKSLDLEFVNSKSGSLLEDHWVA